MPAASYSLLTYRVPVSWNFYTWTFEQLIACKATRQKVSRRNPCPKYPVRTSYPSGFAGYNTFCRMTDDQYFAGTKVAIAKEKVAGALRKCAVPVQVVLLVDSAQGIIDNGGLRYFYEVDFEEQGPYSDFVEAYRAIGAEDAATLLERSIRLFPFPDPHLHELKRQRWLDQIQEDESHEFNYISAKLIGHQVVFPKLKEYMARHWEHFVAT